MIQRAFVLSLSVCGLIVLGCSPGADPGVEGPVQAEPPVAEVEAPPEPVAEAAVDVEAADPSPEPAPAPVPSEPVVIDETITEPRVLTKVAPEYTEMARKARIQGMVFVQAVILEDGSVSGTKILKGLPMGLDQQAVAAIKQWVFEPATRDGQPVAVHYNLSVEFRLD